MEGMITGNMVITTTITHINLYIIINTMIMKVPDTTTMTANMKDMIMETTMDITKMAKAMVKGITETMVTDKEKEIMATGMVVIVEAGTAMAEITMVEIKELVITTKRAA